MKAITEKTNRRRFFGRMFGAAAAVSLPMAEVGLAAQGPPAAAHAPTGAGPDAWIAQVKGTHRTLFDFPQHKFFFPQLHILNYLNTYKEGYKAAAGTVGAVGTFYGIGNQSSIALGFNDATWAKYGLGEYLGLKDAAGKAYTRNVFNSPTKADAHLMFQALQVPTVPAFADFMPMMGIESLQKMGTKFVLCNNALEGWCLELEARGKGKMPEILADLKANLLPGVTIVPAMVIAIEKAQAAGIRYNRQ
jgi:intracellular sulfur oxidation DsrE/DsrF family protein